MTANSKMAVAWAFGISFLLAIAAPTIEARSFLPRNLFAPPQILQVIVSPSGQWIAAQAQYDDLFGVMVQRLGDPKPVLAYSSREPIINIRWIGDQTLFVRHREDFKLHIKAVALRLWLEGGKLGHDLLEIYSMGQVVDALPDEDEIVLWHQNSIKGAIVKKGPITAVSRSSRWKRTGIREGGKLRTVTTLNDQAKFFLVDPTGVPRAAITWSNERRPKGTLMYRASAADEWTEIWRAKGDDETFKPLGFTADGKRLIVSARAGNDTRGLHEFDPNTREFARSLFVLDNTDVVGAVFDYDRKQIIGALYLQGGTQKTHYFEEFFEQQLADDGARNPNESVFATSSSRDYRYFSLFKQSAQNPGTFYFYDKQTGSETKLGELLPGIPQDELAGITTIQATAEDGTPLEGFLTIPPGIEGNAKPPLVVLPHGGPIGIQDSRYFDPLLQYIAIEGIAVLQVNYRGSSGYGKAFEEAGKKQWGGLIEDDVHAVVQQVLASGVVDANRVCVAGWSYGGYSALMSVIRFPEVYRCAATINGVTDLPVQLQSSDNTSDRKWQKLMKGIIGDPDSEYDRLVATSPVYLVDKISVPVLIIHGSDDIRVPPDNAHRLRAMLEVHGKPYDWLEIPNMGHSGNGRQHLNVAAKLRNFLNEHLGSDESKK